SVPASDLYGLGATLIYLVTGLHPTEMSQQDLRIQFADRAAHLNSNLVDWLEWMTEPSLNKRLSSAGEALRALKNPRQIDKTPMPLQPQGSDIKLTKNSEFIEIVIGPQGLSFNLIALLSAAVPVSVYLLWGGFQYILPAVVVMFLFALFRELHLRIDRQQISSTSHLLGLRWNHSKPVARQDICQLEFKTRLNSLDKSSKASEVIVQAGDQKYRLHGRSEAEIEWLATELSQWLGVKIKRTLTDKADEWFC
ncbi:serine/threonine protein kinase, partial [Microcoleus sp. herbarium12]